MSEFPERNGTATVWTSWSSESESSATIGGAEEEGRIGGAAEREVEATGIEAGTGTGADTGKDGLVAETAAEERPRAS